MGAKTIEVKASHVSLISHSDEITRLELQRARAPRHIIAISWFMCSFAIAKAPLGPTFTTSEFVSRASRIF